MPDTGGKREIASRVDAKEAETFQESKELAAKTNRLSLIAGGKTLARRAKKVKALPRKRKTTSSNG